MNDASQDTRIGRLEGRLEAIMTAMEKLEERQSKLLEKLDDLVSEKNRQVGFTAAISSIMGAMVSWLLTHWSRI